MTYTIKDHGVWRPYTPDIMPAWVADMAGFAGAPIFIRRESDGVDFYEYRSIENVFAKDSIVACTLFYPVYEKEIVKTVFRDQSMVFPQNQRLIEIFGVDPGVEKVHKLFTERAFDPVALAITEAPEKPIFAVTAAQARTALFNTKLPDGTTLLDKVEAIVAEHSYRPVKIFFENAGMWLKADPYVRSIGLELGLLTIDADGAEVDSGFDALFKAAAKL